MIDDDYAEDLWLGTYTAADGNVDHHAARWGMWPARCPRASSTACVMPISPMSHWITPEAGDTALPEVDGTFGTLRVRPIAHGSRTGPAIRIPMGHTSD